MVGVTTRQHPGLARPPTRIIEQEYRRAPYFSELFPLVHAVCDHDHELLVDHNLDLLRALCGYLDCTTRTVRASELPHAGDNTDRLIQLTCAVGGDDHLTSTRGTDRKYIDRTRVGAAGIVVRSQEFVRPASRQQFEPFEPTLGSSTFPAVVG